MTDDALKPQRRRLAQLLPKAADKVIDSYEGLLGKPPKNDDTKAIREHHTAGCSVINHIEKLFDLGDKVAPATAAPAEPFADYMERARQGVLKSQEDEGDEP